MGSALLVGHGAAAGDGVAGVVMDTPLYEGGWWFYNTVWPIRGLRAHRVVLVMHGTALMACGSVAVTKSLRPLVADDASCPACQGS